MKMKKGLILSAILLLVIVSLIYFYSGRDSSPGKYDSLAKCIADKKITMYGASWCPHCQNEKRALGSSFRHIPYVECPNNPQLCAQMGVKGYPTWIFPDGRRFEGEQGVKKLARESGCALQ